MNFTIVERVQEVIPAPEEPEIRMIATPEWYEHRHRIVAEQEAEWREQLREQRENAAFAVISIVITALVLLCL